MRSQDIALAQKLPSPESRQAAIEDWLLRRQSIAVADIVGTFGVSEVTARHDLAMLEAAGKLRRVRGGAVSLIQNQMPLYPGPKGQLNLAAKRAVAAEAARFVEDGDVIILDIGSTCMELAKMLGDKRDITVITGDLTIASYVSLHLDGAEVTLLGGALKKGQLFLAGSLALEGISKMYADKAFLSTDAFHPDRGFTVLQDFSISIKQTYIKNASNSFMLLDASKLEKTSYRRFAGVEDFDTVIIDEDPDRIMADAVGRSPSTSLIVANR